MRLLLAAAFVGFLVLMLAYGCHRTMDRYLICRSLGHDSPYCVIAAVDSW